jgi:hypothetical protein
LKVIKQDPRMERPEAAGNEDWVYIGDVDDPQFSVFMWLRIRELFLCCRLGVHPTPGPSVAV